MMRRMGRPGLVGTMARTAVVAGTATAVAGGVHRRQEQKAATAQQAQSAPPEPPPAPASAPPSSEVDITTELAKLAEMKNSGLLSDEEFAAAKAKLLA